MKSILTISLRSLSNYKILTIWTVLLSTIMIIFAQNVSYCAEDKERFNIGINALAIEHQASAYKSFIKPYLIVSPHPDKNIEAFIENAFKGDTDSFALIAYYINTGYAGFYKSVNGKVALVRAMNDGSAQAPFWIAQTFLIADVLNTDEEKIDQIISALHWFGVSAGMGENRAHEYAMDLVANTAKDNSKFRLDLMALYNTGLEEGKKYKLSSDKKR
jgi:hypothetical protein